MAKDDNAKNAYYPVYAGKIGPSEPKHADLVGLMLVHLLELADWKAVD